MCVNLRLGTEPGKIKVDMMNRMSIELDVEDWLSDRNASKAWVPAARHCVICLICAGGRTCTSTGSSSGLRRALGAASALRLGKRSSGGIVTPDVSILALDKGQTLVAYSI